MTSSERSEEIRARAVRLFKFLRELTLQRVDTIRNLERYEAHYWLAGIPQGDCCSCLAWDAEVGLDGPWLDFRKPKVPAAPPPPAILKPWLAPDDIANSDLDQPELRTETSSPTNLADAESAAAEDERPGLEVEDAWVAYCEQSWSPWAETDRLRRRLLRRYNELFSIYQTYQRSPEDFELVLGLGYLTWKTASNQLIKRHLLVVRVQLLFDTTGARLQLLPDPEDPTPRLEQDMLELSDRPGTAECEAIEHQLPEVGDMVLQGDAIHDALRSWVHATADSKEYSTDLRPQSGEPSAAEVRFAPAIILRQRGDRSIVRALEEISSQLEGTSQPLPQGLVSMVADAQTDTDTPDLPTDPAAFVDLLPDEVFFPLVANHEQLKVAKLASKHEGILVQGPPGTGKSHTIANLIAHLLATGKRILVTSQAPRALQVLRSLLPPELAPLCVVALGADPQSAKSLEQSVQGISAKSNNWDAEAVAHQILRLEQALEDARRRQARHQHDLRAIREQETAPQAFGGYEGTLQTIARRLQEDETPFGWLPERPALSLPAPLSDAEAQELLELLRRRSGQSQADLGDRTADFTSLWLPDQFSAAVRQEGIALREREQASDAASHPQYEPLSTAPIASLDAISHALGDLRAVLGHLYAYGGDWHLGVARDVASGHAQQFRSLSALTRAHLQATGEYAETLNCLDVTGIGESDGGAIRLAASGLLEHLKANGSLGSWLYRPKPVRLSRPVLQHVRVNGDACDSVDALSALLCFVDRAERFDELAACWAQLLSPPAAPLAMRHAQFSDLCDILDECLQLDDLIGSLKAALHGISGMPELDYTDVDALTQAAAACDAAILNVRFLHHQAPLGDLHAFLQVRADAASSVAAWRSLAVAVGERDTQGYSAAYREALDLHQASQECRRRDELLQRLSCCGPVLAEALEKTHEERVWDDRLASFSAAWGWAQADAWLTRITAPGEEHRLVQDLQETEIAIRNRLAELGALHAWRHCLARLTEHETQHLRAWQKAIGRIGKGTGKYASQYRREARKHMDECRPAIPAWIMPIFRVAETIPMSPGIFDVVIVDEASQAGPEALFLNYIGNTIIVVGDDKQISPAAVGVDIAVIAELRRRWIPDIPHADSIGGDQSFFDLAEIVYKSDNQVRLREHFRCMPEIIQFSNDLCYSAVPLIPLKQYGAGRLWPTVQAIPVHSGRQDGSSSRAINKPEAEELVDHLVRCCAEDRYKGKTMGVISLLGGSQARYIQDLLIQRLGPEEMQERRIHCGDAYAFQGDERDVIFLSMVSAPNASIGPLSRDSRRYQQRFNVAASRAKEQMTLFHTAEVADLSVTCLRRQFLEYCQHPHLASMTPLTIELNNLKEQAARRHARPPDPFDSWFEVDVYCAIAERGYRVTPQHAVAGYHIDLVVEGMQGRMAVECDGDEWHGPERYAQDMDRQRQLMRAGYPFWRVRGSVFYRDPDEAMADLWRSLNQHQIRAAVDPVSYAQPDSSCQDAPIVPQEARDFGAVECEPAPRTEPTVMPNGPRVITTGVRRAVPSPTGESCLDRDACLLPAPRSSDVRQIANVLTAMAQQEGPIVAERPYRRRQPPRVFSREEAQAILGQCRTRVSQGKFPVSLRNRCALECLYRSGLRVSELCDLRVRDVDLQARLLYVRHSKRDKSRNVPIDPRLMPWLTQWAEARTCIRSDVPSEWFFCSGSGAKTTQPQLYKIIQRCCEAAGIETAGASPHTFRHTFATECLEDGFDLKEVSLLLGHSSVATTEIYLHVRPQTLRAKVDERVALPPPREKDFGR